MILALSERSSRPYCSIVLTFVFFWDMKFFRRPHYVSFSRYYCYLMCGKFCEKSNEIMPFDDKEVARHYMRKKQNVSGFVIKCPCS